MKINSKYVIILLNIILAGCSQYDNLQIPDLYKTDRENTEFVNLDYMISNFYEKINANTRNSNHKITITGVSTQSYEINDSNLSKTRFLQRSNSFDIHTVSVDFGESQGYVILSDTPGLERIFFYTESGHITDTVYNKPLKNLIDSCPKNASKILSSEGGQDTDATEEYEYISPLVRFEWHQGYPFNKYGIYCECSSCSTIGNHKPIGCVAIALAQTIATLGNFSGTFYGTKDIDFCSLPNRSYQFSESQANVVGHFVHEIAVNCQMKFGCSGSGTSAKAAYNYLKDLGYECDLIEWFLDKPRLISNLKNGFPHLVAGHEVNGGGHMWIIDGYVKDDKDCKYHMNWGWGYLSSNGWSSDSFFTDNLSSANYSQDHRHIYLSGSLSWYPFE